MQNSTKEEVELAPVLQAEAPRPVQLKRLRHVTVALPVKAANAQPRDGTVLDVAANGPSRPAHNLYRRLGKRLLDLVLVTVTLPISIALIGIAAMALWIEGGKPFYSQDRLGRGGRVFRMYKLRTMSVDADERLEQLLADNEALRAEWHFTQKLKDDPRITPIGRFLRRSSMDELPQLWNVVTGDMSLIGPRPMMPDQLPLYGDARSYIALKPGLTGLWQVRERNESRFSYRAQVDRTYDHTVSLWLDAWVLWKTVGAVLRRTGY
ncbi:MAG: sugar transferase [Rhodobacter sp.]|nr:sugar transferase [Rhodobacter sp.]